MNRAEQLRTELAEAHKVANDTYDRIDKLKEELREVLKGHLVEVGLLRKVTWDVVVWQIPSSAVSPFTSFLEARPPADDFIREVVVETCNDPNDLSLHYPLTEGVVLRIHNWSDEVELDVAFDNLARLREFVAAHKLTVVWSGFDKLVADYEAQIAQLRSLKAELGLP